MNLDTESPTLADHLRHVRNQVLLGYVEVHGLLEREPRFGGQSMARAYYALTAACRIPDLAGLHSRILSAALKIHLARSLFEILPDPHASPDAVQELREARSELAAFRSDLDRWLQGLKARENPPFVSASRARAFVRPDGAARRAH